MTLPNPLVRDPKGDWKVELKEEKEEEEVTEVRSREEGVSTASERGLLFLLIGAVLEDNWRYEKYIHHKIKFF